jgi:hypothetical protein
MRRCTFVLLPDGVTMLLPARPAAWLGPELALSRRA